jgi:hypothetical protein
MKISLRAYSGLKTGVCALLSPSFTHLHILTKTRRSYSPTMRWIFEVFMGVIQSVLVDRGKIIKVIVRLSASQTTILGLLGKECENYYGLN